MVPSRTDETETRFFDDFQRRTVEAAMARIIPSDHEPGATRSRDIDFLDRYLSGIDFIFATPDGSGFDAARGEARRRLAAADRDRSATSTWRV